MRTNLLWLFRFIYVFVGSIVLLAASAWGLGALYFHGHRIPAYIFFGIGLVALAGFLLRFALRAGIWSLGGLALFALLFVVLFIWYSTIKPSNDHQWQPDVIRLASGTLDGDLLTVRNIRNLDYRTETDYTVRYYDKTYDLKKLTSVDVFSVYWMGPSIAHLFLSFGFEDKDYLAISVELRKEVGETYQALPGLFRRYEIYYVVADERDVVRVRTTFRKDPPEHVYLYRTKITKENARTLLLDYVNTMNDLAVHPDFYNTLTTNCTTAIYIHARAVSNRSRYNWKLLLSGYTAEYMYEIGSLNTSIPFEELQRRSLINDKANTVGNVEDFSQKIREGLPFPASPNTP